MSTKRTGRTRNAKKEDNPEGQGTLPFQTIAQLRKPAKRDSDAPMNEYPMSGITVEFPFKPYPAQIQMMSKIVSALKDKQNALLESPTGSGKSLAILCASLAWAGHEKKRLLEELEKSRAKETEVHERVAQEIIGIAGDIDDMDTAMLSETNSLNSTRKRPIYDDDDDFRPVQLPRKLVKADGERSSSSPAPEVSIDQGNGADPQGTTPKEPKTYIRAPKIYVGSRTHKQLSQLVGELRRNTRYRPKMSILGSREHYCIHPKVKKAPDKTEACAQHLDSNSCIYAKNVNKVLSNGQIMRGGASEIWDIEDLTQIARHVKGCSYFASRTLSDFAEIVFCPYNYLLDPLIRSSMDVNLADSVVVLDEAHNIEDVARSSGSLEVTEVDFKLATKEMTQVLNHRRTEAHTDLKTAYSSLLLLVESIHNWMKSEPETSTLQRDSYEEHHKIWKSKDLINALQVFHVKKESLKAIEAAYDYVEDDVSKLKQGEKANQEDSDDDLYDISDTEEIVEAGQLRNEAKNTRKSITMKSIRFLEGLIMIFKFILPEEGSSREKDYSMVLIRRVYHGGYKKLDWELKLAFWCLNPAIVFRDMASKTRSVILTSGTLSPLDTFASELETPFPVRLEANHVIDKSQVWIRSIMQGPQSVQFHGTWERASQFQYQDDVGESLYQISETIPYGILCFIPSYSAMEKLIDRWKSTRLYDRLENRKHIICEPSGKGSKDLFEQLMNKYYYHISEAENNQSGESSKNGAILFAVYRGKVSEGIDFTDNNCRAVVALGIPFPNIKDVQVELKREYNTNRYKSGDPVLDGGGWYRIQAYRAINQALGRCIRHRQDWGAVILLESRFCEPQNIRQLSKWVRPLCMTETNYPRAMEGLREFVAQRSELERLKQERLRQEQRLKELLEKEQLEQERLEYVVVKIEPTSPPNITKPANSPHYNA